MPWPRHDYSSRMITQLPKYCVKVSDDNRDMKAMGVYEVRTVDHVEIMMAEEVRTDLWSFHHHATANLRALHDHTAPFQNISIISEKSILNCSMITSDER